MSGVELEAACTSPMVSSLRMMAAQAIPAS